MFAQIGIRTNGNQLISIKFLNAKIVAAANQSFFNILIIKNNSDASFTGKVNFTQPANWSIIGEKEVNVTVLPHDSLNIPIRVIVSNTVFGEIAYAVVASLFDKNNRPILSEYCFINIPRVSDLKIDAPKEVTYFDNKTETARFQYSIKNHGNTNEIIQLDLKGNEYLSIEGKNLNEEGYTYELNIPAHTDTVVEIDVKLDKEDVNKNFYQINIDAFTQDSLYKSRLWFNKIYNEYNHTIPENNKCAIIELTALDILSKNEPRYALLVKGRILFKKDIDLYYHFRENDLSTDLYDYYNTRAYVGIKTKHFQLHAGTVENTFHQYAYGLGGKLNANFDKISFGGFYTQDDRLIQTFYGGQVNFSVTKKIKLDLGYAENAIELYQNYSKIALAGLSFSFLKRNRMIIKTYANTTTHAFNTPFEKTGYAILSSYSGNFNKLRADLSVDYGSPEYSGISRGRFLVNSSFTYKIDQSSLVYFYYTKSDYQNVFYINDILQPVTKQLYDNYQLFYSKYLHKNLSLYSGAILKVEGFNNAYINTNPGLFFKTINPRLFVSAKLKFVNGKYSVDPRIDFGNVIVTEALDLQNATNESYFTYNIYLNLISKNFNFYLQYRNGPFAVFEQYRNYIADNYARWLFVTPAYHKYFFNNTIEFDVRVNYSSNINTKESNLTLTPQVYLYLPKSWTFRILNTTSSRSRRDAFSNASVRYNTTYFEAAIRKEFNCKQPRFQYYDLKVVFFKDLNGNRKKEANEPGLRNILASIEPDLKNSEQNRNVIAAKLLTGSDGNISYTNIVNGAYNLKYILIGDMVGNFNREEMTHPFIIDGDKTIYIPYLENNRIIGKVILNRDPLSSLEQNIDISNIRVIAEDTKGHSYSALTDKQGNFILYTPVTDHYVVKINNIFYESFDIQQPEYIVKFNGYKQFEVTFVFEEKKKKINFDNNLEVEDLKLDDIKVIRKTTLSGKIRDAISLEPIEAEIKIIDNKNNRVVTRAISNRLNGNYSISYAAGTHFRIEVISKDHWEHVENLYIEQVISIQNINKDIMLNKLSENKEEQKTFIIYDKEEKFEENFKRGQQIPINYLNFDLKQTRLDSKAKPELDRLIDLLNKNKSVRIEIAGHADDKGNSRIENIIAKRRAEAVKKYLTSHGLPENRITVKSYSNSRPLIPGTSEKARSKNRRVEIIVQ